MKKFQAKPFYRLDTRYENRDGWPIEPIMVYRLTGCKPKMGWRVALFWGQYPVLKQYGLYPFAAEVVIVPWKVFAEHLDSVMEVHND